MHIANREPTATEFIMERPKYSELMQIASAHDRESLVSFAQTIDETRGDLSMRCQILTDATDIMLSRALLGAKKRLREQLVDLSGESETADAVAADHSVDIVAMSGASILLDSSPKDCLTQSQPE